MKKTQWTQAAVLALGLGLAPAAFAGAETDFALALASIKEVKGVAVGQAETQAGFGRSAAEQVITDNTTTIGVELNENTVKCSAADYSAPMLKVLVPELARLTVLNHRNTNEGAPCLAAGECKWEQGGWKGPEAILKPGSGSEQIRVRVVLKKVLALEGTTCRVTLVETVTTKIRGVPFFHERQHALAERVADDCR